MQNDVRLALRSLRRAPGYAAAVIAALAIAIGSNTALFSLISATLLRSLPYPHPERVVMVREQYKSFGESSVSVPNFRDWRAQTTGQFSGMAAFRRDSFNLTGSGEPIRVSARMVAADFFSVLGAEPQLGRFFGEADDAAGAPRTVVLGNWLWQKIFASDPRVVGQTITLSGDSYTVIGIAPPGFQFFSGQDLFVPLGLWSDQYKDRGDHPGLSVVARLKPAVTIEQAQAALDAVASRLEHQYPESNLGRGVRAKTLQAYQTESYRSALFVLWGAVALVLLIAAANVANLALARAAARAPELAVRAALGAGRRRLMRELLTESVLLAVAGGVLGVLFAFWGLDAMLPLVPEALRRAPIRIDSAVLAFTLLLSVATGLAFGALPALRASRPDLDCLLREAHSTESRPRRRLRSSLVVAEIALSLMLLIGAGLLLRSFEKLARIDLGFEPRGLLTLQVSLPASRYPDGAAEARFVQHIRERLSAIPGVQAVGVANAAPLLDDNDSDTWWIEGRERPRPGEYVDAYQYSASPGFLAAMGTHLLRGRDLRDDDGPKHPAALVDDGFARKLFPNGDALGQHIAFPPELRGGMANPEIVGIFSHMQQYGPLDRSPTQIAMVLPLSYTAAAYPQYFRGLNVLLRTEGDPAAAFAAARRAVQSIDPELPLYETKPMRTLLEQALSPQRFSLVLLALFAAVALLLAAVGVYGVVSYRVVQRTREIGIRMALGARQEDVLRLVVGDGAKMAAGGVVAGLALSALLARVLRGMLYGVSAFDPLAYCALTAVLVVVAMTASWLPARRASRVDPNEALRAE
ncbi:MAG TPA: ABC transporter permease [Myxococcales bacterium]|jgi:putative ABC transport system permease protein